MADYYDRIKALYNALDDVISTEIAKNVHPDIVKLPSEPAEPSSAIPETDQDIADMVKQKEMLIKTLKKCSKAGREWSTGRYTNPETIRLSAENAKMRRTIAQNDKKHKKTCKIIAENIKKCSNDPEN